jgi:hypothetical protein
MQSIRRIMPRFIVVVSATLLFEPAAVQAGFIVAAETKTASPGATGFLEVTLRTDGTAGQTLSGFSLNMSLAGSGVSFTGIDNLTSTPYVFGVDGLGVLASPGFPNQSFTASDISFNLDGYVTLDANTAYGLARVGYQVNGGATAGLRAVSFQDIGAGTSFTDAAVITYTSGITYQNGGVDVTGGSGPVAPAPPGILLAAIGAATLAGYRWRLMRRA